MPNAISLIVGLGNPDPEHILTRHNAGFWFLDLFTRKLSIDFRNENKFQSQVCRFQSGDMDCWLCKPMTFMNSSGSAVRAITDFYKIPVNQMLVVHDEIDLDVGVIKFKQGGGHGGHNGLRDIIEKLGSNEFKRLRIGVGHPGNKELVTSHLLDPSNADDNAIIMDSIVDAMEVMPEILEGEFMKAMTKLHTDNKQQTISDKDSDE